MQELIMFRCIAYSFIIEHVPARVCTETGEQFFSPETVEHIQAIIQGARKPDKVIETPVYEYT
jgi:hypothetical protein